MGMMIPSDKDAAKSIKLKREPLPHYPRFQPLIFSIETTFPIVKLGQVDKWQSDPAVPGFARILRWWIWFQILLSWFFGTLFLAALFGIVQHG